MYLREFEQAIKAVSKVCSYKYRSIVYSYTKDCFTFELDHEIDYIIYFVRTGRIEFHCLNVGYTTVLDEGSEA